MTSKSDNIISYGKIKVPPASIHSTFSQSFLPQQDHLENALRIYAAWLVRATRLKLTKSPSNNDRINLTSEANKRSNSLNDNRISMDEDTAN